MLRTTRSLYCLCWALLAIVAAGCNPESLGFERPADSPSRPASPAAPGDTISVASFNIQVFGVSKMNKPEAVEILVDVARRFDVLAIQELRAADQTVVPQFVDLINADGSQYQYVVGPRLGRTLSKEQYVYIYDAARIEVDPESVYTARDPGDLLHREPLVARFRVRGIPADQAFTFSLVNIHTDPDDTDIELDALADVFTAVQNDGSGEDDIILLGDLNVDQGGMGRLAGLPGIGWTVRDQPTNTRETATYDNIVYDTRYTTEFTGYSGVMNLQSEYHLTMDQALVVSDHYPVWAEFSIYENARSRLADRPETIRSAR